MHTLLSPVYFIVALSSLPWGCSNDDLMPDIAFTAIRRYRHGHATSCCSHMDANSLHDCLQASSSVLSSIEDAFDGSETTAIFMMTSKRLSLSYGSFSEASIVSWVQGLQSNYSLAFLAFEIDDGKLSYGVSSSVASEQRLGKRAPHWLKVAIAHRLVQRFSIVLYVDADATIVHTRSVSWFHDLISRTRGYDFVISRESEGPSELIYSSDGAMRLNDATYVNTGVLLFRQSAWTIGFLREWWLKADEISDYKLGRTYDQGALGHLFYTHGTPMKRKSSQGDMMEERRSNEKKASWRRHISVVEPEIMNNHAPGGSFKSPSSYSDSRAWWCQHFKFPILQLSGQDDEVRRSVLGRVWREGACAQIPADVDVSGAHTSQKCAWLS